MASKGIENVNPQRFVKKTKREVTKEEEDESVQDPVDEREIFGKIILLRSLTSHVKLTTTFLLTYLVFS